MKNKSEKSVKLRESGHYWVKWSGAFDNSPAIWRMAAYWSNTNTWGVIGEERVFYDADFIEINENRIPFDKGQLYPGFWVWIAAGAYILATAIYIILIYKEIIR
jgi:hypothetical protein